MNECCNGLKQHFPEHCLSRKSTAEENGRKLTLSGSKNFCLLRVDGCWVDGSEQKKCDFIMFCCDSKRAFITEIKGKNIVKACEQIENTYRLPVFFKIVVTIRSIFKLLFPLRYFQAYPGSALLARQAHNS